MYAKIRPLFAGAALFLALGLVSASASAALSIASSPLFLTISLPPNLVVLLDDSGSLQWAHAPDSDGTTGNAVVPVGNAPATATTTKTCTAYYGSGKCKTYSYVTTYACPTGTVSAGSGSSMTCSGYTYTSVYIPDTNHYKSSAFNPLAYNPLITYTAPYTASGTQLTTSFTAAYVNGFDTALGTIDLATNYEATVDYNPSTSATTLSTSTSHNALGSVTDEDNSCNGSFNSNNTCASVHNPGAAFYYTFTPTSSTAVSNLCGGHPITGTSPVQNASQTIDDSCYTKVTVSSTSSPNGTDERQNFANWYSFYRTRNLTVASSADIAFNGLSQTYRVAWLNLHTCPDFSGTNCIGWDSSQSSVDNRIATFTGQHRTDFFNWLTRFPAKNGTNLRQQLDKVGTYYTTSGEDSPYASDPQNTDLPEYVCRPNYAAVMTDGEWNEATSSLTEQPGNADSTAVTLPDNTSFTTSMHPYSDSNTNTLSDVAFHYWSTDLRPDLGTSTALQYMRINKNVSLVDSAGNVANVAPYWNPENDPAQWPHMVTFTIGLGLSTDLTSAPAWGGNTYAGGYNDLVTGHTAWPSSFSCGDAFGSCTDPIGNIYDLWHAAIDSRGEFFAADDPQSVVSAFNTIINRIQSRVGSSSSIAVNSTKLGTNTLIFQAQFNSSDWSGEVLAYQINPDGSVGALQWQASTLIPTFSSGTRTLFTWNNTLNSGKGGGTAFTWANLTTAQQGYLNNNMYGVYDGNGSLRLNYLSGDQSQEQNNGGAFRNRNVLLGDIVNSNPQFVGTEDFGFDTLPEGITIDSNGLALYDDFVASKSSRAAMLYVGANDGMLHAINSANGKELWAFVPRGVYPNLSALTDPTYTHKYLVDGSPESTDAYFGSTPSWHTLLAAGDGAGGREVFLLDVTNPTSMTASDVLYDYDGVSKSDNNMGYPLGQPSIARMNDGNFYMIWGNGYNSPNGHAVLYLYNINSGALTTFDTGSGSITNPNGMSAPAAIDTTNDRITDTIYAGDLYGNLWKLNVSSTNPSQWGWAFTSGKTALPLFTATDANGNVQPITVQPQVALNKNNAVTVMFGTGTYFQTSDNTVPSSPPVQSFYGIIDANAQVLGAPISGKTYTDRSELLQQSIVAQSSVNGNNFRVTTPYTISSTQKGWYMDFNYPTAQGERIVSDPVIDNGRIIFTTLIPQSAACQFGGTSWLMELDITSGSQLTVSPLDVNGDGKVNNNDYVTVTYTDPATNQSVTKSVPVSGEQSTVGIIKTPGIISAGSLQYKYFSGSTGTIGSTVESNPTSGGRLSWQQLQ